MLFCTFNYYFIVYHLVFTSFFQLTMDKGQLTIAWVVFWVFFVGSFPSGSEILSLRVRMMGLWDRWSDPLSHHLIPASCSFLSSIILSLSSAAFSKFSSSAAFSMASLRLFIITSSSSPVKLSTIYSSSSSKAMVASIASLTPLIMVLGVILCSLLYLSCISLLLLVS